MPLTRKVEFQNCLQKRNRIQIPKIIRWQFKLETDQVLNVGINAANLGRGWQHFYAKMKNGGYISVPKLMLLRIQKENEDLSGHPFQVALEPT